MAHFPAPRLAFEQPRVNDWIILDSRLDEVSRLITQGIVRKRNWRLIEMELTESILRRPSRKLHLPDFNLGYFSFTTLDSFQNFPIHDPYYVTIADKSIVRASSAK